MAQSDEELLGRIAGGDRGAMQALYARHSVRIYRFIMARSRNAAIAEELTHEAFIEIWRSAPNFRGASAASTWMFSIARNTALSALRRKRENALDEEAAGQLEDASDTPETAAQKTDKRQIMLECINKLTADQREVIDLVYYQEKSVAEVSEITG
ncbi:MAG: sigma-70 family RNA polymerase sigma factor, partial [Pseudomonadota bacterium]|nr:sigma-70 family RNA polymerase sigma factor [Pseudomonadota bacterium]